ncbi:LLM class flavin-dependent oxidoreductase [Mycobacterium sp. pUA109]|uniref:LLM class flavin-dependent oxidoreductase n=1 Tax=Mycobacterium sp. pUA109 TaxID=3238982 RepID=UPI00351ACFAF
MPMLNQPLSAFPAMARAAEDAGFDAVWNYEFYRNPFLIHALAADATERIQLATGLAITASRTPFEFANAAADVDEVSGGRLVAGMGIGAAGFADAYTGAPMDHPAARLREYIEVVKLCWKHFATGEPVEFHGKYQHFASPPFNPFGTRTVVRPEIPIYLAALRPTMLKLAGEVADGVIGYMMSSRYLDEVVWPNLRTGAQRAGRDPKRLTIASETICSVSNDRAEALRRAKIQVGVYASYPVSEPLVAQHGLQKERLAVLDALMKEGPGCFERVVDDKLVEALSITGTPDECRRQLRDFGDTLPHVIFHTPYVTPLGQEESADAYRNIIETFAR